MLPCVTRAKSPVFYAPGADPAILAASERARATFKYLWRELTWEYRRIIPALELAAVKAAFGDEGGHPDEVEHMWLSEIEFDGDTIQAVLLNRPNHLRSVKAGDRVTLTMNELEDWMYVMRGKVHGGFTIQAMRKQMPLAERRVHDQAWGFDFGDPDVVSLVPDWNAKPPTLLGRLFGSTPVALPPDPDVEHPMSENMAAKLAEAVGGNPAAYLRQVDEKGMTTLHGLALGGSAAGVRVLLEKGADATLRNQHGKTALDLAEQMGWPRVVELLRAHRARA
jgi:uncharacterized protein YegJ (DUF2314 family)